MVSQDYRISMRGVPNRHASVIWRIVTGYLSHVASSRCVPAGHDESTFHFVRAIKTYPTRLEADVAKIALDAADIPSVIFGVGVVMEGGVAGVRLLVPDDQVDAALTLLERA